MYMMGMSKENVESGAKPPLRSSGAKATRTTSGRQLAVTAAYASTDYRAQGQIIGQKAGKDGETEGARREGTR
jgi:hypothetical protein